MIIAIQAAMLATMSVAGAPSAAAASLALQPIVGGYREAGTRDPGVTAAASFAARALHVRLARIGSAAIQIVAGTNYRIEFTTRDRKRYRVVVYRPLSGGMRLTSHEQVGSGRRGTR